MLRAAFRDAHGARLHGFALLVTLGDERLAASLAADALDAGARHADALRHPERAAAWLRRRVLRRLPSGTAKRGPTADERRFALARLGVDNPTYEVLERFSVAQRAALVAGVIEGLGPLDLELVLDAREGTVRRRLAEIRRLFLERRAAAGASLRTALAPEPGSLEQRIQTIVDQALSRNAR